MIKKVFTLLLLLLWMWIIFGFSAQNGRQSGGLSHKVAYKIAEIGDHIFHLDQSNQELQEQAESMQFIIRKGAHMSEYALLAILLLAHLLCYGKRPRHLLLSAWILCILFAGTDEFHQLFVSGRAGQLRDVCIDAAGSLMGAVAFLEIRKIIWKKRETGAGNGC